MSRSKWRSTEFWLSLLSLIAGALLGAGVFGDGSPYARAGGWLVAALASSGYAAGRSFAKVAVPGKPGYKTTEFWAVLASAALVWAQSHAVPAGWAEIVGSVATLLPIGSYSVARGVLKGSSALAAGASRKLAVLPGAAAVAFALVAFVASCGAVTPAMLEDARANVEAAQAIRLNRKLLPSCPDADDKCAAGDRGIATQADALERRGKQVIAAGVKK